MKAYHEEPFCADKLTTVDPEGIDSKTFLLYTGEMHQIGDVYVSIQSVYITMCTCVVERMMG